MRRLHRTIIFFIIYVTYLYLYTRCRCMEELYHISHTRTAVSTRSMTYQVNNNMPALAYCRAVSAAVVVHLGTCLAPSPILVLIVLLPASRKLKGGSALPVPPRYVYILRTRHWLDVALLRWRLISVIPSRGWLRAPRDFGRTTFFATGICFWCAFFFRRRSRC